MIGEKTFSSCYRSGALGFTVLRIWPILGSVFVLKNRTVFRFWWLGRFAGFCQPRWRFFGFFCPMHFTVFLVLSKKSHPTVPLKLLFQGTTYIYIAFYPDFLLDDAVYVDKPSLFQLSSRYLGRNGCQADYEMLNIISKQKTISQISCAAGIIPCGLWP